jgi:hypothetical protein
MVAGFSLTGTKRTRPFETTFWNLPKYKMYLAHRGRSRPLKHSCNCLATMAKMRIKKKLKLMRVFA